MKWVTTGSQLGWLFILRIVLLRIFTLFPEKRRVFPTTHNIRARSCILRCCRKLIFFIELLGVERNVDEYEREERVLYLYVHNRKRNPRTQEVSRTAHREYISRIYMCISSKRRGWAVSTDSSLNCKRGICSARHTYVRIYMYINVQLERDAFRNIIITHRCAWNENI